MPYYNAGDYYQGDYYQAGGLFGTIGKLAKAALNITPLGRVASTVGSIIRPNVLPPMRSMALVPSFGPGTGMSVPEPGITGTVHRIAPGGHPGYGRFTKKGEWTERRRPRMQVTNTRALKRAGRRVRGFLRIARQLGALPISGGKGKKLFKRKHR
jgi:hypothetical protein